MQTINFKFSARVKKIDIAFERATSDDDRVRALDIKLTGIAPDTILAALLGCDPAIAKQFWSSDGLPALTNLGQIKSTAAFDDCLVKVQGSKHAHTKLRNFSFDITESNSLTVSFTVRFVNLDEARVGHLCALYDETAVIDIQSSQTDMLDGDDDG